jgi:putative tricarboxylic transport membrane protein
MAKDSNNNDPQKGVVSNRTMNIVVALMLMIVAAVVMIESYWLGAGWAKDVGPDSGYFPFYIGLFMFIASAFTFFQHLLFRRGDGAGRFVARGELKMILQVLIPMTAFVILAIYIGIYISMVLFIGFFMVWLGRYPLYKTLPVAIGIAVALFVVFEIWFLIPLPKGPFEAWLGY